MQTVKMEDIKKGMSERYLTKNFCFARDQANNPISSTKKEIVQIFFFLSTKAFHLSFIFLQ